ncbi:MAG: hypothetical protein ACRC7S_04095 [Cetobacterium sp.]
MKVKCIDDKSIYYNCKADGITKGKKYIVVEENENNYIILNDNDEIEMRVKSRFEIVEEIE